MADRRVSRAGDHDTGLVAPENFRDESDGTFSPAVRSRLEGWDPSGATWIKVAVDSTGAIATSGSTAAGGGGAVTVASGADVTEGATTDAAVVTDTTGTVNGKLRGLVKWAFERMPAALGQTTKAGSLPVTIASDQGALTVSGTVTANAGTGPFPVSDNAGSLTIDQATASLLNATITGTVSVSASTIPITDNGGSITVDGSISVAASTIPVTDNGGSLTVDAPVGTPVFVRQSDGTAALIGQKVMASSLPVVVASDQNVSVQEVPASTIATAVSTAAGAAITLTLAGVASQFHYITGLEISAYNTSARTGGATPVTVTTTNITGSPAFTFGSAGAIGTTDRYGPMTISDGLKSTTSGTATTIVCPATAGVIWRINVVYRAGV